QLVSGYGGTQMSKKLGHRGVTILLGLLLYLPAGLCKALGPDYPETKQLMSRVKKAAALVEREGEKAFAAFRTKGGEWYQGDTYIFVGQMNGVEVCHPAKPELEGKNLL